MPRSPITAIDSRRPYWPVCTTLAGAALSNSSRAIGFIATPEPACAGRDAAYPRHLRRTWVPESKTDSVLISEATYPYSRRKSGASTSP